MGDVQFKIGQIGNEPRIRDTVDIMRRELERRGMPNNWPNSDLYHYAAFIYDEEVMTMMLFAPIEAHRKVYVTGAYTRPSWRRLGLYDYLWNLCVEIWRKDDLYDWLQSGYHKNNLASQKMQEKQGRVVWETTETTHRTRFCLRPIGDERDITVGDLAPLQDLFGRLS
jgi:hypothetical protein